MLPFSSSGQTMKNDSQTQSMSRRNFVQGASAVVGATMLTALPAYPAAPVPMPVLVQFEPGGRVTVASASRGFSIADFSIADFMAQTAAATLHLRVELVDVKLGDSRLPASRGPQTAQSPMPAVQAAAKRAQRNLFIAAAGDRASPLHGADPDQLEFNNGRMMHRGQPESGESFTAFLARNGNVPLGSLLPS